RTSRRGQARAHGDPLEPRRGVGARRAPPPPPRGRVKSDGGIGRPRLGAPPVKKAAELLQLVAFSVGPGQYALGIIRIKEIINPVRITPVPKAPAFIEGVIELRGTILPVVDMRKRFDLDAPAPSRSTKFLVVTIDVSGRRMIVALIVDGVSEPLR